MGKLSYLLNLCCCNRQSREDCTNIGSWLHRDDSELIFFVDPDEESLFIVVEDASSFGPVSVEATCIQKPVAFFKEEVISN